MTMKTEDPKSMGCSQSNFKRENYSNTILSQETRKISDKQTNLTPKATRKKKKNSKLVEGKKSSRAEIHEVMTSSPSLWQKKIIISFVAQEEWNGSIQVTALNGEDLLTQIFIYWDLKML